MKDNTQEFSNWYEAEKNKGLVDIKFFTGDLIDSTVEGFYEEALAFLKTPIVAKFPTGF